MTAHASAENGYETVAVNFLKFLGSSKEVVSSAVIETNEANPALPVIPVAYHIKLKDGGYILISASRGLTPVKAYSLGNDFEALPEAYRRYLLSELESNIRALGQAAKTPQSATLTENQRRWDFLLNYAESRLPLSYAPGTYLLTTMWNQGYPYNKFLPRVSGQNVLAGCVNIALAQLMKYHGYPLTAQGVAFYTWNSQQLKSILYKSYNWQNMPDTLDSSTPEYMVDEVALLIENLGVTNRTAFSLSDSGASINVTALIENFGFSDTIREMDNSDITLFFDTLRGELDSMRPVLLVFPGHMTVADGYSSNPTGREIHVNMGWGGLANNYYFLDEIVYAGNKQFNPNLSIYYNLKPCSGSDCSMNLEAGDSVSGQTITGRFNFNSDADRYGLYLKGQTSISGTRGYSNQAFFISLYDSDNNLIAENDAPVAQSLSAGKYTLKISLCNKDNYCYLNTDPDFSSYTVSLSTSAVTDAEKISIDNNQDMPPVINNNFRDLILNSANAATYKILIDARDPNGDALTVSIANTNNEAVEVSLTNNILSITPLAGAANTASKITVAASANNKTAEKSFIIMVSGGDIFFGREFMVNGTFENRSDFNSHKVILDGNCTITGDRGYSNQAFFTSVRDVNQAVVATPDDVQINSSFAKDIYFLGASLEENPGGYGTYYDYEPDKSSYFLKVSCPDADDSTATIAGLIGIDLSGTQPHLALNKGWNFISVPLQPANPAAEEVLKDILTKVRIVWGYDNQAKQWLKYKGQGSSSTGQGQNTLTAMEAGKGYWIFMNEAAALAVSFNPSTIQPLSLYEGWNLVGYNSADNKSVSESLGSIAGKWDIIWNWENHQWKAKAAPDINTTLSSPELTTLNRGRAYWIRTRQGTGSFDWMQ